MKFICMKSLRIICHCLWLRIYKFDAKRVAAKLKIGLLKGNRAQCDRSIDIVYERVIFFKWIVKFNVKVTEVFFQVRAWFYMECKGNVSFFSYLDWGYYSQFRFLMVKKSVKRCREFYHMSCNIKCARVGWSPKRSAKELICLRVCLSASASKTFSIDLCTLITKTLNFYFYNYPYLLHRLTYRARGKRK